MLLCFGLGTAPALLVLGSIVSSIGQQARLKLYRLSSLAMIVAGGIFFYRAVFQ
jgi:sulfite exporter TauE/SafE